MSVVLWPLVQGDAVRLSCCVLGPRHKIPQTGGLNIGFSQCWAWKTKTRVSAWSAPGESPLPSWHTATFPHAVSSRGGESELRAPSSVPSRGSHPPVLI